MLPAKKCAAIQISVERRWFAGSIRAETVCPACPLHDGCAYLAQAAHRADIWLVPHNLIFLPKPRALGDLAWLIVDENPIGAALIGAGNSHAPNPEDRPLLLTIDTLRRRDAVESDPVGTDQLHEARGRLHRALGASPNTRLMRAALVEAGLTVGMADQQIGLEYGTKIEVEINNNMALANRLAVLRTADANEDLDRRVMLWREVAALLRSEQETSSRAEVVAEHIAAGMVRALRLKGRRTIETGWRVRTTIIDATL